MTTANRHHSYVTSMRSLTEKTKHYKWDDAYREGRKEANDKYPCALIPEKYYNNKELADAFSQGFADGTAERNQS